MPSHPQPRSRPSHRLPYEPEGWPEILMAEGMSAPTRRLAEAGRGFGTKRLLLAGVGPARAGHANTNALLFGFDDVPPYYLICFVTLGLHVRPSFRFVKRQCVVNAIPFDDGDILGRSRSLYVFDPSQGAQRATLGSLDRFPGVN